MEILDTTRGAQVSETGIDCIATWCITVCDSDTKWPAYSSAPLLAWLNPSTQRWISVPEPLFMEYEVREVLGHNSKTTTKYYLSCCPIRELVYICAGTYILEMGDW